VRVVLLAYHFPPDPAVGSLRAAKVARAFADAGHEVHVVTARLEHERRPDVGKGITVHAIVPWRGAREFWAALKTRLQAIRDHRRTARAAGGEPETSEDPTWRPPTQVPAWKRFIFACMWLPDDRQGFVVPAMRAVRALGIGPDDLLYSTCPPYSPHLAALLLARATGARWVAEYRDPWTGNVQKPWWVRTAATDAVDRWLERRCLRRADLVVSVSEGIDERLRTLLPEGRRDRAIVVRNGIETLAPTRAAPAAGPRRILHVGTFSHGRDPRPFLEALAAVVRRRGLSADAVRVDLVGQCRHFDGEPLDAHVRALGLGDIVRFEDWVPHARARELIDEASVLLLLAQQQPDQVPNKLYEYLGARRPILAWVDEAGESARMLRRVGGHAVVTPGSNGLAEREIERLLDSDREAAGAAPLAETNETILGEWTSEVQMRRLLDAVGGR
jgi:glycosyltransferase involved in cell wall biosynthesis